MSVPVDSSTEELHHSMVTYLIVEQNIDVSVKDDNGYSALDLRDLFSEYYCEILDGELVEAQEPDAQDDFHGANEYGLRHEPFYSIQK
jgi:hypothetical protein